MSSFRRRALVALAAVAATIAAGSGAAAKKPPPTLTIDARHIAAVGQTVVVTSHGRTLYRLKPETVKHWLCTSKLCKQIWRPLLVGSRSTTLKKGASVSGSLSIVDRPDGKLGVAFRGLPLYTYSGDGRAGDANGEGIRSFGGIWHVVAAASPRRKPFAPPGPPSYSYPYPQR